MTTWKDDLMPNMLIWDIDKRLKENTDTADELLQMASANPRAEQEAVLADIVGRAKDSAFG